MVRVLREIVDKLINGFFEYENRKLTISSTKIELSLSADELYEGSFRVASIEGVLVNGYVYSSNTRMRILTKSFEDVETEIQYEYNTMGLAEGDVQKGDIYIVSDSGEYYLPYVINIHYSALEGTQGTIKNLFHFTNLAQSNWEEAVKLFYSKGFIKLFEGNERTHLDKYLGLSRDASSEQNVDEFLVAVHKKQAINYIPERTNYEFQDVEGIFGSQLTIQKTGWGYVNLHVESDSAFLRVEKETISDDDFLGNDCSIPFFLHEEHMHAGKNYGKLLFRNSTQSFEVVVIAEKAKKNVAGISINQEQRRLQWKLMKNYVAFRTKQIAMGSWVRESMKITERLNVLDEKNPTFRLYQAQLLLVEERFNEAKFILDQVESTMHIKKTSDELYCYYLYLNTLYQREESYVNQVAEEVKEIFKQRKTSWRILWTILYLDEELELNPSRKLALIERQYEGGCTSPAMYIEAYNYFVLNPSGLVKLTEFEIQVLYWAVRNKQMDRELLKQVIYLSNRQKNFSEMLLTILIESYKIYQSDELTGAICTLLIKDSRTDVKYFKWYQRGVEAQMRITRLYEYYMLSIPLSYREALPKPVLMYFTYNNNLDYVRTAFLYANVLRHEDEMPEMVRSYERYMQQFVKEQILLEHINKDLAYVYEKVLHPEMITADMASHLAKLLFVREIIVDNPRMKEVVVLHGQFSEEFCYPIVDMAAYPQIYSKEYEIFLQDAEHNRYVLTEGAETRLMEENEAYIVSIRDYVSSNIGFCLYLCEGKRHYIAIDNRNAEFCRILVDSPMVKEDYKREIRPILMQFYYDNDKIAELDDFLQSVEGRQLDSKDRAELTEYLVRRGMYDEAYHIADTYGIEQLSPKTCVKLCSYRIGQIEQEIDEKLLGLCHQAFKAGKYDVETLSYLTKNFEGLTKEMRNIWLASTTFDIDSYYLKERMIIQMLFTGTTVGEKEEIFESYLRQGSNTSVELAYLSFNAYEYFAKDRMIEDKIFDHLLANYRLGENLNDACKLALLKHYAEEKSMDSERTNAMIARFVKEFIHKNMFFKFFMDFQEIVPELSMFSDKTIIEYSANPQSRVILHYVLEGGQDDDEDIYIKEEMRNMYGGIFSKEFILFFGENLQYYITEVAGEKEKLTESNSVSISDVVADNDETRFDLLNDMVVSQTLKDEDTLLKLMDKYVKTDYLAEQIFTVM